MVLGDEGDGEPGAASPRRPPDAVDVVLGLGGDVVVEDDVHVGDVQPTTRHIRRQQDRPGFRLHK